MGAPLESMGRAQPQHPQQWCFIHQVGAEQGCPEPRDGAAQGQWDGAGRAPACLCGQGVCRAIPPQQEPSTEVAALRRRPQNVGSTQEGFSC